MTATSDTNLENQFADPRLNRTGAVTAKNSPADLVSSLINGPRIAQAVFIIAKLGIPDLLGQGPKSAEELATATGTHAPALYRVLRALASIGVLARDAEARFVLTPASELLRSGVPGSLRAAAIMNGEQWVWRSWGAIEHSVRTGQAAFEHLFGAPLFEYYASNPEAARISADALNSLSAIDNAAIAAAYDFSAARTVVDIGGGQGSLLAAVLVSNPTLRGILFERPQVVDMARSRFEAAGLADRCELIAGNFFAEVPRGGDIYLLKKVIHDWNDEDARLILSRCRAAMAATARLLIAEHVVPADGQSSPAMWVDLLMLVYAGGQERTAREFQHLLASARFELGPVINTASPVSILESAPR